ncbi:MAG: hypothetical protein LBH58_03665 [Tannerellaceae bacterium]|nr:hypothetical protein [Tannerellaceae bacterium]
MFIFFLAILIFYGGGGVNMVSYCCDTCHTKGTEVAIAGNCCHAQTEDNCCQTTDFKSNHLQDETCCQIERINFEWNNELNSVIEIQQSIESDILLTGLPTQLPFPTEDYIKALFAEHDKPPAIVNSRHYLSLFSTLLI